MNISSSSLVTKGNRDNSSLSNSRESIKIYVHKEATKIKFNPEENLFYSNKEETTSSSSWRNTNTPPSHYIIDNNNNDHPHRSLCPVSRDTFSGQDLLHNAYQRSAYSTIHQQRLENYCSFPNSSPAAPDYLFPLIK